MRERGRYTKGMRGLLLAVVLLGIGLGCGPTTRPLRGDWVMAQSQGIRFTFRDNGTYEAKIDAGSTKIVQHGNFSQNGTWLNIYTKKVETNQADLQAAYDRSRLEPQRMQVRWVNDNHVVLDSGSSRQSMKRVGPDGYIP